MEKEIWKKIKNKLSSKYKWFCIEATKENEKGRAKGGIIMAVSKEIKNVKIKIMNKGVIDASLVYNKKKWRIITLYSQNIKEILEDIMREVKEEEEEFLMIGGDFNARTGNEGGPIGTEEKKEEEGRRSKDKVINKEGREMINKIGERGWIILNESYEKEGEWTYIGEIGTSVIDYVVTNEKAIEEVKKMEEGNRTESDHVPLEVELEGKGRKKQRKNEIIVKERNVWTEEGVNYYHSNCEEWLCTQSENEEIWRHLEEKVKNSMNES